MGHRRCSIHGWYSQLCYQARILSISYLLVTLIDSSKPRSRVGENWVTWGMMAENQCSRPQMKGMDEEGLWLYVKAYRWNQIGSDVA